MHPTTPHLTAVQRTWPLLSRLSLLINPTPPEWAVSAARGHASVLTPGERARFQADCPALIADLGSLRMQWYRILVVAVLLAIAVGIRATEAPLDMIGTAVFGTTMYAILLPALLFQIGITYDLVAAVALQQALRIAPATPASEQRGSGTLVPSEVYVTSQAPVRRRNAERVDQDIERQD